MQNEQTTDTGTKSVRPAICRHTRVNRKYTEETIGTVEKQYCASCGEFVESRFHEGKKIKDLDQNPSVWRRRL